MPAHQGFNVLADHLGPGEMQPLNVVVTATRTAFDTRQRGLAAALRRGGRQTAARRAVHATRRRRGAASFTSFTWPLAAGSTLSVADQLGDQAKAVRDGIGTAADGRSGSGRRRDDRTAAQLQQAATGSARTSTATCSSWAASTRRSPTTAGYQKAMAALTSLASSARRASALRRRPVDQARLPSWPQRRLRSVAGPGRPGRGARRGLAADLRRPTRTPSCCPTPTWQNNEGLQDSADRLHLRRRHRGRASRWCSSAGPYTPEAMTPPWPTCAQLAAGLGRRRRRGQLGRPGRPARRLQPRHDPGHHLRARRHLRRARPAAAGAGGAHLPDPDHPALVRRHAGRGAAALRRTSWASRA